MTGLSASWKAHGPLLATPAALVQVLVTFSNAGSGLRLTTAMRIALMRGVSAALGVVQLPPVALTQLVTSSVDDEPVMPYCACSMTILLTSGVAPVKLRGEAVQLAVALASCDTRDSHATS